MERPILALAFPLDGPVDPGFGNRPGGADPGYGHGHPRPPHVDNGHPWGPGGGHIDNNLPIPPAPPSTKPPPPQIWPPSAPIFPERPGNELPMPPGAIWPPLPPGMPEGQMLVLVYITGLGWHWTVIDTTLEVDAGLPASPPPTAGNELPPTPAPK